MKARSRQIKIMTVSLVSLLCLLAGNGQSIVRAAVTNPETQQADATSIPEGLEDLESLEQQIYATLTATALTATAAAQPPTSTPVATATPKPKPIRPVLPTPTPTAPTARSAPSSVTGPVLEVLIDGVNLRSGPGREFPVIGSAKIGQQFIINGQAENCAWLRIGDGNGARGWITGSGNYVFFEVSCTSIPVAAASVSPPAADAPVNLPTPTSRAAASLVDTPIVQASASNHSGLLTDFEPLGVWKRGDEPYGDLTQSATQADGGSASAQLSYSFPATAGNKNYVVFSALPPLSIPASAQFLQARVFGDRSGHFLNVWVSDSTGAKWQFTLGRINHQGWASMATSLTPNTTWPNGPVGGTTVTQLTPPLFLTSLVLDGVPEGVASQGSIYLDTITAVESLNNATASAAPVSNTASSTPIAPSNAETSGVQAQQVIIDTLLDPTSLTGKIAYSRFNGSTMDTYVYDLQAQSDVAYVPNKRQPDLVGNLLLANGEGGNQDIIFRMTSSGDNDRPVTMHVEDSFPQWSPSTESIVYSSSLVGDGRWRLYWQRDASEQVEVPPLKYGGSELFGDYPVYLDNWRIAYLGCNAWAGGSKCGIYAADSKGAQPIQVTTQTSDIPTGNVGSQILFTSNREGNHEVYIVNWDGSGLQRLTNNPAVDGLATGSPDGQHLAFVSNRDGTWAVYVMNLDGSNQTRLFDIGGGYGGGAFEWYRERISWGK
jgi:hypothetical protein